MESIIQFITDNVQYAPYLIFFLLLLAGLNIPLSEDVLVLAGGYLAGGFAPEEYKSWYLIILLGCWLSAWESYWIGRKLGPKLYDIHWFSRWFTPKLIDKLHGYYEKYGIWTFIVGRFFPGGVRNALFISSGLGKMPFLTFILRDAVGCVISCTTLFFIGFSFAHHSNFIFHFHRTYHIVVLVFLAIYAAIIFSVFLYFKRQSKNNSGQ